MESLKESTEVRTKVRRLSLSKRLERIYQLLDPAYEVWDLCCDHGLIGRRCLMSGRFPGVIFVDKSELALGPLRNLLNKYHYDLLSVGASLQLMVGDMLKIAMPSERANIVISGVGAHLIVKFLSGLEPAKHLNLVLGPNKSPEIVRTELRRLGWSIRIDEEIFERGRKRWIMQAQIV